MHFKPRSHFHVEVFMFSSWEEFKLVAHNAISTQANTSITTNARIRAKRRFIRSEPFLCEAAGMLVFFSHAHIAVHRRRARGDGRAYARDAAAL